MILNTRLALFKVYKQVFKNCLFRQLSSSVNPSIKADDNFRVVGSDKKTEDEVRQGVEVYKDFITAQEEEELMKEIQPKFKRLRYESSHWDDAIQGFREIERAEWSDKSQEIINKIKAVHPASSYLQHTHILDLSETGVIRPHVDSVKFCGDKILGLCLLSGCVMRFRRDVSRNQYADVVLPRYCLYVMKDKVRYEYTHEVLNGKDSVFEGVPVNKGRRISVLLRTLPPNSNIDSYSYKR